MSIKKKLVTIQERLKAPKGQRNSFGNYNYRSCEDILEAVKPLLIDCFVNLSDEVVMVGNRFYIKATATLFDAASDESVSVSAFAREEEAKKGMDGSQVTGASSSYARKYALNGLFAIDDTKDSDSTNTHEKKQKTDTEQTKHGQSTGAERMRFGELKGELVSQVPREKVDEIIKQKAWAKDKPNLKAYCDELDARYSALMVK